MSVGWDRYYGWVIAGACFLSATVVYGLTYSFGVFFTPLLRDFPVGPGTLSLAFGLQTFVLYVGAVAAGGLIDTIGAQRAGVIGAALTAVGLGGTALSGSFPVLLWWYGVVTGMGLSVTYVLAYATVPRWFGVHRGMANGIASSGLGIGLLVVAPASAFLISMVGWRATYLVLAGGALAVMSVAVWLFEDSPDAIGADISAEFPDGRAGTASGPLLDRLAEIRDIVWTPRFASLVLGWAAAYAGLYVIMNHIVRFAEDIGLAASAGVFTVSIIGVTTSIARVTIGAASDRFGRGRVFLASTALMAVTAGSLPLVGSAWVLWAIALVFGIGYGGAGALLSPLLADLFGAENLGTLYGLASISFAIAGLTAPPLAGIGYGMFGGYGPVFLVTGMVGLVGTALIWGAGAAR
ncbi:MAG: MFS transporter [Halodesulfurarchaeum sp.]